MLVKSTLENELRKILDKDFSNFKGFPDSYAEAATNFGNAINSYAVSVVPTSTASTTALSAFVATFVSSVSLKSVEIIVNAIHSYATALAVGMLPAFNGVAPIGKSVLKTAFLSIAEQGKNGMSASQIAGLMASAIDTYFRTGTAINVQTLVTVNWS